MFWSEHQQRLTEYAPEVLGAGGTLDGPWTSQLLGRRSHTIWGGTAEIQRNIVGERVLGLPKEPSTEGERRPTTSRSSWSAEAR